MGLFSPSKATEIESLINLIVQRFEEYIEIQEKTPQKVHSSVCGMFGSLYNQLFNLYYPNRQSLDSQFIIVQSNRAPILIFIVSAFNAGLAFENDMDCKIFIDDTQRTFAKSLRSF